MTRAKPSHEAPVEEQVAYYAEYFTVHWHAVVPVARDCENDMLRGHTGGRWDTQRVKWLSILTAMQRPHPDPEAEHWLARFQIALVYHRMHRS